MHDAPLWNAGSDAAFEEGPARRHLFIAQSDHDFVEPARGMDGDDIAGAAEHRIALDDRAGRDRVIEESGDDVVLVGGRVMGDQPAETACADDSQPFHARIPVP